MKTEHFKYFSVPLFRVTCVLQNLPEADICKSFILTVLLGTESFTKTASYISGELSIYTINKIKRDFDIDDISGTEDIVEISIEGAQHGRLDNCS